MSYSILTPIENLFHQKAISKYRPRRFFEKVWLLALCCVPLQLWAQFFSFESECRFLQEQVIMGNSQWAVYQTYALALIFELLKATAIGVAIRQFFLSQPEFVWWAFGGLALSFGSWWMSDQGTIYLANESAGQAPTNESAIIIASVYQPQVESIEKEMLDLERDNFWWCGLHRAKHTNEECNAKASGFYINKNERSDRLAQAKINELKERKLLVESQMNEELSLASQNHQQALGKHQAMLSQAHISLQAKVLASELVIWLCTLAVSYILYRLYEEKEEKSPSPANPSNPSPTGTAPPYGSRRGRSQGESPIPTAGNEVPQTPKESHPNGLFISKFMDDDEACINTGTPATPAVGGKNEENELADMEVHWSLEADGYSIVCDECQTEAILAHSGRFCGKECRMNWHKRKMKEQKVG